MPLDFDKEVKGGSGCPLRKNKHLMNYGIKISCSNPGIYSVQC